MKKLNWLVIGLALWAVPGQSQETPKVDFAVGYSPLYILKGLTIWMNGASGSVAFNANNWFGVVGEIGAYRGHIPESFTGETYMVGLQFYYRKRDRLTPFVQALFGGSHFSEATSGITGGGNQFAFALGGGADFIGRSSRFALRPQIECVGISSSGSITPSVRLSIGIVYRFSNR